MELRHPDAPEPASAPRHDPAPDPLPAPDAASPKPASGVKLAAASNADRPDRSPAAAAPNRAPDSAAANPNPTAGTSNPASPNPDHAPAASNRAPDPPATDHDPSAAAANPGPAADPPTAVPPTPVRNPTGLTTRLTTHLHRPIPNGQALILAILLLAAVNYALHRVQWVENLPELATSLAMTALFVALAWWSGHASEELGLDRKSWPLGLKWSGIIVVGVALVYLAAAVFPGTRGLFTDARYASLSASQVAVRVFIDVPFATVLAEEVAFRGVLFGLALRRWKPLWATVFSSLMFGLWHILSSLHLNTEKPALTSIVGRSTFGATLADIGTVVFTGLGGAVFCELRRRSGSLLVPMSFHWATNALGYVFGFLLRIGAIAQLG